MSAQRWLRCNNLKKILAYIFKELEEYIPCTGSRVSATILVIPYTTSRWLLLLGVKLLGVWATAAAAMSAIEIQEVEIFFILDGIFTYEEKISKTMNRRV